MKGGIILRAFSVSVGSEQGGSWTTSRVSGKISSGLAGASAGPTWTSGLGIGGGWSGVTCPCWDVQALHPGLGSQGEMRMDALLCGAAPLSLEASLCGLRQWGPDLCFLGAWPEMEG